MEGRGFGIGGRVDRWEALGKAVSAEILSDEAAKSNIAAADTSFPSHKDYCRTVPGVPDHKNWFLKGFRRFLKD